MEPGIHDEAEVEKVAQAIYESDQGHAIPDELWTKLQGVSPFVKDAFNAARAALSAIDVAGIRAGVIETCAKIADDWACECGQANCNMARTAQVIAESIRALSMGKENGE